MTTVTNTVKEENIDKNKSHNGFLRNKHRKAKKTEVPQTNNSNHTPLNNTIAHDITAPIVSHETLSACENDLFQYLRQKYNFNETSFWATFEECIKNKSPVELSKDGISLFSYCVIYEKEAVLSKLLNQYGTNLEKNQVEELFPLCINKNPELLKEILAFYDTHFKASPEFLQNTINQYAKSSYRQESNAQFCQWIVKTTDIEGQAQFWQALFKANNVVLIDCALNNADLFTCLQKKEKQLHEFINNSNRKNAISQKLMITSVQTSIQEHSPSIEKKRNSPSIETKENSDIIPEVVVKRRRKLT